MNRGPGAQYDKLEKHTDLPRKTVVHRRWAGHLCDKVTTGRWTLEAVQKKTRKNKQKNPDLRVKPARVVL